MSEQDPREELQRLKNLLAQAEANPPMPFHPRTLERETATGVLHWTWNQDINSFSRPDTEVLPGTVPAPSSLARNIRDMPDPLVSLADAIVRMASDCRQHGVVPVGINVRTEHLADWNFLIRDRSRIAATVHVDVSVVPRQWVIKVIHEAEQADHPTATEESSEH